MTSKIIDHGLDKAIREFHELASLEVASGILPDDAKVQYDSGITVGEVAAVQVYGTETIPQRDFIGGTADAYRARAADVMQLQAERVAAGANPMEAAKDLGEWFQGRIQAHILNGPWAPNAPSTIKRKGHGEVLIETRRMYNHISNEVRKK